MNVPVAPDTPVMVVQDRAGHLADFQLDKMDDPNGQGDTHAADCTRCRVLP